MSATGGANEDRPRSAIDETALARQAYEAWDKKAAFWGDAIIEDSYVKENGVWKISARRYYQNFEAPYQGGWAKLQPISTVWQSDVARAFPPDSPSPLKYQPFLKRLSYCVFLFQ